MQIAPRPRQSGFQIGRYNYQGTSHPSLRFAGDLKRKNFVRTSKKLIYIPPSSWLGRRGRQYCKKFQTHLLHIHRFFSVLGLSRWEEEYNQISINHQNLPRDTRTQF